MNFLAAASSTVNRALFSWVIAAGVLALSIVGVSGTYIGYQIASARGARAIADIKNAQIEALKDRARLYEDAVKRSDQASSEFFSALKSARAANRTITTEVRQEVEKLVYADCKVPDSGAELLRRKVEQANSRLIGGAPQ